MKELKYLGLAFLVAFVLVMPAVAQKGGHGNTDAGKMQGQARAEEVQTANGKGDKDHTPSKGSKSKGKKTRTREGWEKNAKHKDKGSSK